MPRLRLLEVRRPGPCRSGSLALLQKDKARVRYGRQASDQSTLIEQDDDDDIFGFASRGVSEEALLEMRRKNAEMARRAMLELQGGNAAVRLPAIYAHSKSMAAAQKRRTKLSTAGVAQRARRGPKGSRAETPTEIRDAARSVMAEAEAEAEGAQRPPTVGSGTQRRGSRPGTGLYVEKTKDLSTEQESELLFRLLDWQKEVRAAGFDTKQLLRPDFNPRSLFDTEIRKVTKLMSKHNAAVKKYVQSASPSREAQGDLQKYAQDVDVQQQVGAETRFEGAEEVDETIDAAFGLSERTKQENKLQGLIDDGFSLRHDAMSVLHAGGAQARRIAAEDDSVQWTDDQLRAALNEWGRNTLLVLHGILETGMGNEEDHLENFLGSYQPQIRQKLMEYKTRSGASAIVGKKRAADRSLGKSRGRGRTKQKSFQHQILVYSSLSGEDETAEEAVEDLHERTMSLLRETDLWSGGQPGTFGGSELERRLYEMQKRNKRMARMAYMQSGRSPAIKQSLISSEDDDDIWDDFGPPRRRPRRPKISTAYRVKPQIPFLSLSPSRGWTEVSSESEDDMVGTGDAYRSQTDRRGRLAGAGVHRREGGRRRRGRDQEWMDYILPSGSEEFSDGDSLHRSQIDVGFLADPKTQSVLATMAQFKMSDLAKQDDIVSKEVKLHAMRGGTSLVHSFASPDNIAQTQQRIYKQVHRIRKEVAAEIKSIFRDIGVARKKMERAVDSDDPELKDLLNAESQKLIIDAETRAIELRKKFKSTKGINMDFMPSYVKDFITHDHSAQVLYDRGRIQALQAKAAKEAAEEEKLRERAERRQRQKRARQGLPEEEDEVVSAADLTAEDRALLDSCNYECRQLNSLLKLLHVEMEKSKEGDGRSTKEAGDAADAASQLLEQSLALAKAIRRRLLGAKGKRIKKHLPPHLKNLINVNTPLMDMWKEGRTEAAVCRAKADLARINADIAAAKLILKKFDEGDDLDDFETDNAVKLLEGAIIFSVEVRERARAAMLDESIGGEGIAFWRFPKHLQNFLSSEESPIVLWEKGLSDPKICGWISRMSEINNMIKSAEMLNEKAAEYGENRDGLGYLAQVDDTMYKADNAAHELRKEIRAALHRGMQMDRLPPHLQNLMQDTRPLKILHAEGKTDPVSVDSVLFRAVSRPHTRIQTQAAPGMNIETACSWTAF